MAAGIFSALGYSAIAQTTQPAPVQNRPAPAQNRPAPAQNRPVPSPNQTGQQSNRQVSALDRQFVIDAAQGGMAEVQLGQLALERSRNPEVKQFARQMIQEHTRANERLMRLATQKGITPPTTPGPKYEASMSRLMQLSGESFDQAYMNEAGVNAHMESAAVYQRQAGLGQDPDLKAFAATILPRVQGHLEMASEMTGYRFAQQNNARPGMSMPQ
jgi:putative membrane protein